MTVPGKRLGQNFSYVKLRRGDVYFPSVFLTKKNKVNTYHPAERLHFCYPTFNKIVLIIRLCLKYSTIVGKWLVRGAEDSYYNIDFLNNFLYENI